MEKFENLVLKLLCMTLMPILPCFGGFVFQLNDEFAFTKTDLTIEHLDHDDFELTAATTGWVSNKEFVTYILQPELFWTGKNYYLKAAGYYGWDINGRVCEYPLKWNANGNVEGFDVEAGYIFNVCDRFNVIPFIGYEYELTFSRINHQGFLHTSPDSFISQNGDKSSTLLYFPYIGIELDFKTRICKKHNFRCFASYQVGYGGGHGRKRVNHTVITDNPATSRYGSNIKYRDMVSHEFEVGTFYIVDKKWQVGIELDYFATYNTHKLPLKFHHNDEIVAAGQYTPTQYHRVSDYMSKTFSVIFAVIYNFSGEGTVVR